MFVLRSSWQILTFSPRIVSFVRICGTHNTANEVFHCVHFECPCQPDALQTYLTEEKSDCRTEGNSIPYEEFAKHLNHLSNITEKNFPITNGDSLIQTHTILPFTIKPNSVVIFPVEQEF